MLKQLVFLVSEIRQLLSNKFFKCRGTRCLSSLSVSSKRLRKVAVVLTGGMQLEDISFS